MSRPAHAGLDFVEDEENAPRTAQFGNPCEIVAGGNDYAPFPLQGFKHYRADILPESLFKSGQVIEGNVAKPGQHGAEAFLVLFLPRGAQGGDGPAVEGVVSCNDDVACLSVTVD